MTKIQKLKILFLLSTFYFLLSSSAQAAKLYFEPQELTIGTTGEFSVGINIDADKRVNAFSLAISISEPLIPFDINEANSIINFWVDKPNWDKTTGLLTFSGITPGGFQGEKGRLLVIKFKTNLEAGLPSKAVLDFNKEKTKVYLHTADGIEDSLVLEKIELPIVKGKENIPVAISDNDPPEWFAPEISQDQNLFDGKYFLVFATQDKKSGIDHYEILENRKKKIENRKWELAESPYVLKDQKLQSWIFVKAIDRAENERIAELAPQKKLAWYEYNVIWVIIILGIVLSFYFIRNYGGKRK